MSMPDLTPLPFSLDAESLSLHDTDLDLDSLLLTDDEEPAVEAVQDCAAWAPTISSSTLEQHWWLDAGERLGRYARTLIDR